MITREVTQVFVRVHGELVSIYGWDETYFHIKYNDGGTGIIRRDGDGLRHYPKTKGHPDDLAALEALIADGWTPDPPWPEEGE
jgi:hypothetical protein